ncbi:MAG: hypothetical protein JOZ87_24885 [Chloroflexi bacterium]|nr:hypothetical protein [Chloroflexota bacterium]
MGQNLVVADLDVSKTSKSDAVAHAAVSAAQHMRGASDTLVDPPPELVRHAAKTGNPWAAA